MKTVKLSSKAVFIILSRLITYKNYISEYYPFLSVYNDKMLTAQLLCSNIKEYGGLIMILINLPKTFDQRVLSINDIKKIYTNYSEEELIYYIEELIKEYPNFIVTPKEKLNTKLYYKAMTLINNCNYKSNINRCAMLLLYIEALSAFNPSAKGVTTFNGILNFEDFNPFTTDEGFNFWSYVVKNIQNGTT